MVPTSSQLSARVDAVLDAITDWLARYGESTQRDLAQSNKDDVRRIARDLGMTDQDVAGLSSKSPKSAALLEQMLAALGVKAEGHEDAAVHRDLQRLCMSCSNKRRCVHEFDAGVPPEHFHEYCPNTYTLEALLTAKHRKIK
jgi:hypothetical protein